MCYKPKTTHILSLVYLFRLVSWMQYLLVCIKSKTEAVYLNKDHILLTEI